MENATKFLIIAGAVLIAIVLISVGMMLVNNSSGAMDQATQAFSKQEVDMFNSQFKSYNGKQNGSNVKVLIDNIISNNIQNQDSANRLVSIDISGAPKLQTAAGKITGFTDAKLKLYEEDTTTGAVTSEFGTSTATIKEFNTNAQIVRDSLSTGTKYTVSFDIDAITNGGMIYNVKISE